MFLQALPKVATFVIADIVPGVGQGFVKMDDIDHGTGINSSRISA